MIDRRYLLRAENFLRFAAIGGPLSATAPFGLLASVRGAAFWGPQHTSSFFVSNLLASLLADAFSHSRPPLFFAFSGQAARRVWQNLSVVRIDAAADFPAALVPDDFCF